MGLAGLGLSARAAAPLFPGVVRAPAYFTELWVALGALAFALLVPAYIIKLIRYPGAVREEFTSPVTLGFCAALPVGMSLVAGGIAPYSPAAGKILWWLSFGLVLGFQAWGLVRLFAGGIELAQVNAGWLIIFGGGFVLPGPGVALGYVEASRFSYGFSALAAALLMPLLLYRAFAAPPLPTVLRPSWFILLVPASLIYANGLALYPGADFLENLYFFALVLAVGLMLYSKSLWKWEFGVPWWAFTFPLDALAYAAARYAQDHPSTLWRAIAAAMLAAATAVVLMVLWRTLRSAASRRG
jgi:tellurite resistance protein